MPSSPASAGRRAGWPFFAAALTAGCLLLGAAQTAIATPLSHAASLFATAPGLVGENTQDPALVYLKRVKEAATGDLGYDTGPGPVLTKTDLRDADEPQDRLGQRLSEFGAHRDAILTSLDIRLVANAALMAAVEKEAKAVRERALAAPDQDLVAAGDDVQAFLAVFNDTSGRSAAARTIADVAAVIARTPLDRVLKDDDGWTTFDRQAAELSALVSTIDWSNRYITDDIALMAAHRAMLAAYMTLYSAELEAMREPAQTFSTERHLLALGALAAPLNMITSQTGWERTVQTMARLHEENAEAANRLAESSGFRAVGAVYDVPVRQRALCVEARDDVPREEGHVARLAMPTTLTYDRRAGETLDRLPYTQQRKGAWIWKPSIAQIDDRGFRAPCSVVETGAVTEDGTYLQLVQAMRALTDGVDYHLAQVEALSAHHAMILDLQAQADASQRLIRSLSSALASEPRIVAERMVHTKCRPRRRSGIDGSGVLRVDTRISSGGYIREVTLINGDGFKGSINRALRTIDDGFRCSEYEPHIIDEEPVDARMRLVIEARDG